MRIYKTIYLGTTLTALWLLPQLTLNAQETQKHIARIIVLESSIWEDKSIPVCWENASNSNRIQRKWVRDAVLNSWEKESAVVFTGWGDCNENSKGLRFQDAKGGARTRGLGNKLDGKANGIRMDLSKVIEKNIRITAIHEFGHAIGFAHEHNRNDRPADFTCRKQGTEGDRNITPYDLLSIMNYCRPDWAGNGFLSSSDIHGVVAMYGSNISNRLGKNETGDDFSHSMATGDFNGDGITDLAVGAPGEAIGELSAGAVFVYIGTEFGGLRPWLSLNQASKNNNGISLGKNENGDKFGFSITSGDFNNDGFDDLAVGAPGEAPGSAPRSGFIYVYKGGPNRLTAWKGIDQRSKTSAGKTLGIRETDDQFGHSLVSGDFDDDQFEDLAIGAPGESPGSDPKSGAVYVFGGSKNGLVALRSLTQRGLSVNSKNDKFGSSFAKGDFNGDGVDDLAVGAHFKDSAAGAVYTFVGSLNGLKPWAEHKPNADSGKFYGYSLASGDFNNDGKSDLVIGAPFANGSGHVVVLKGSDQNLKAWQSFTQESKRLGANETGDVFGWSFAVGDLDNDSIDDLAIGAPGESIGKIQSGTVFILKGSATGILSKATSVDQRRIDEDENGDFFGHSLAIGNFNGTSNGNQDTQLIVGSPSERTKRGIKSGWVYAYGIRPYISGIDVDVMRPWYSFGQQY